MGTEDRFRRDLEKAKKYFYSWKLVEAYNIFRRYFDRLPFRPEREHVEYISMFSRTLVELGKEYELKFYLSELERLYSITESPEFAYQLGVIYTIGSFTNYSLAKEFFEKVISRSSNKDLRVKAAMFMAKIYDHHSDVSSCRKLIDSMEDPEDPNLKSLVQIWRAKVYKDEGRLPEARKTLDTVLNTVTLEDDWYAYFSCRVILVSLLLKERKASEAQQVSDKLRENFRDKMFKSLIDQLDDLDKRIKENGSLGFIQIDDTEDVIIVCYKKKKIEMERRTSIGRLMKLFLKNDTLSKNSIIKAIYDRDYAGEPDNKLIYYHIHNFRKELEKIGLTGEAVEKTHDGYRLVPELKMQNGEML